MFGTIGAVLTFGRWQDEEVGGDAELELEVEGVDCTVDGGKLEVDCAKLGVGCVELDVG